MAFKDTTKESERPTEKVLGEDSVVRSHPAFAMIGAARVSRSGSGQRLYGSDLNHHAYVTIRIATSSETTRLHNHWFSADKQIVEVQLSEAQWASFVSSLNCGDGVPCTIRSAPAEPYQLEWKPEIEDSSLHEKRTEDISRKVKEDMAKLQKVKETIDCMVSGEIKTNKETLRMVQSLLLQAVEYAPINYQIAADMVTEHMEHVTGAAKAEIEGYVTMMALRGLIDKNQTPQIAGDEVKQIARRLPEGVTQKDLDEATDMPPLGDSRRRRGE